MEAWSVLSSSCHSRRPTTTPVCPVEQQHSTINHWIVWQPRHIAVSLPLNQNVSSHHSRLFCLPVCLSVRLPVCLFQLSAYLPHYQPVFLLILFWRHLDFKSTQFYPFVSRFEALRKRSKVFPEQQVDVKIIASEVRSKAFFCVIPERQIQVVVLHLSFTQSSQMQSKDLWRKSILVCCTAPALWNSLPEGTRTCKSLTTFKSELKTLHFLNAFLTDNFNVFIYLFWTIVNLII